MTTNYLREINKVSKEYALDQVSVHVSENSVSGLLGPNDAGKSTLLKLFYRGYETNDWREPFCRAPWQREHLKNNRFND